MNEVLFLTLLVLPISLVSVQLTILVDKPKAKATTALVQALA
eukprot:CAMPEP_0202098770 /NCGR_PEP_ID=MMETSP0965-20130614/2056_1 /ASSEMBLY_ACC=CAM_ASM_000507 /TAXON_ID=4773 /ORGANISM="Schizochytrium aggregatum, Strain ATCC28209" /LENGTH=41 /DNA_ID= /DNA_START= /DNA_END= /DNA_ORIENTATION=